MTGPLLLEARGLAKSFGGVHAVRHVDFAVHGGEVHALVGENGAGKSTLVKMLSGIVIPDTGTLAWDGRACQLRSPLDAQALGIQTIHQELELLPSLSVAENIFLGSLPGRNGLVDRTALRRATRALLEDLGAPIDPDTPVRALYVGDQQIVEIAKALSRNARVLFMDEPTAALPPVETDKLMAIVRRLRDRGVGIVYISHKLDEILGIADRITVMRDGTKVAQLARGEADRQRLVELILGRELGDADVDRAVRPSTPFIAVRRLHQDCILDQVSFEASVGELVGFFGLLGAGQSAIAEALFGCRSVHSEAVRVGENRSLPSSPAKAIEQGFGYVPSDRKGAALALNLSIWENLVMSDWSKVAPRGLIRRHLVEQRVRAAITDFDIRCHSHEQPVGSLSGGNQQKVVLARWHDKRTRILLLDEPTRGVDVGAKAEIYRLLSAFARSGGLCLIFSSDAEEISAVCDRAYVMRRGAIVGNVPSERLNAQSLIAAAL